MMVNVVVQTAFLGDVLLSIPLLKKIKALYPLMDLILVCRRGVGDFFIKTGLVQQVLEVEKNQSSSYKKALAELQTKDIYHLVAPHESFRTAVFCWQLKAKNKTSFSQPWSFLFFQQRIKKNKLWPEALRQLSLVQDLDSQLKQNLQSVKNKTYTDFVESKLQKVQLEPVPPWASMSLKNFFADLDTPVRLFKKYKKTVLLFPGS
ncbi:MAG: glycosyltransferase family 9 protein, partial [Pseudobdellovibrionaceae bacterium]